MLGNHWSKKLKTRNHWRWLVKAARLEAKVFVAPQLAHARVTIERTGARILDHDNAVAGTKFLTDALVREGFITGDTLAHIGKPDVRQFIDGKIRRTLVRIEAT